MFIRGKEVNCADVSSNKGLHPFWNDSLRTLLIAPQSRFEFPGAFDSNVGAMFSRTGSFEDSFDPLVITVGDPCGVGPEVIHGALKRSSICQRRDVLVIGDVLPFARALGENAELHNYHLVPYDDFYMAPEELVREFQFGHTKKDRKPYFLDLGDPGEFLEPGEGCRESAELALASLDAALGIIDSGIGRSLVTGPISKRYAQDAGFPFPGHTEAIANHFGGTPLMVMVGGGLRVALATIHEPLAGVSTLLTKERVALHIDAFAKALSADFGMRTPRIAVCGFNPHAGEAGRLGDEEENAITPAVELMREKGLHVDGPVAADAAFPQALEGMYDGVLAMYHDQGLIPVKLLAFYSGVNVTSNLRIVRTSPDHGTAYNIAGTGKADPGATHAAIELADAILRRRDGDSVPPTIAEQALREPSGKPKEGLSDREKRKRAIKRLREARKARSKAK